MDSCASGCGRASKTRGLCHRHYEYQRSNGLIQLLARSTPEERFWAKVYLPPCADDCWLWIAGKNERGYGTFMPPRTRHGYAHRYSYELTHGAIPAGLDLDHTCRTHSCVNPSHLRAVTTRINCIENSDSPSALNAQRTHCIRGHPFDALNTYYRHDHPWRNCKACRAERQNKRRVKT